MRAYMGYNRHGGASEGAILIFANNIKEAKKLGWEANTFIHELCDSYIDFAVEWLKNSPWIFEQKLTDGPHVVEFPKTCTNCMTWGYEMIDNLCVDCHNEIKDGE